MTRRRRPTAARTWLLFGILCVAMGVMPVLVAVGVLDGSERGAQAPPWVIGLAGSVFVVVGIYLLIIGLTGLRKPGFVERISRPGQFHAAGWLVGAFVVTAFFALSAWIAWGPGPRSFSGSAGGTGLGVGGPIGESVGRTAFGVSAVLLGAIGTWVWIWGIRRWIRGRREQGNSGERKLDSVVDRRGRSP